MATAESSEDAECPTCGRDDFASRRGMKMHHSRAHGESLAGVEVECENCGCVTRKDQHGIRNSENQFCSKECHSEFISERVETACANCSSTIRRYPYQIDEYERHFCDGDCYTAWKQSSSGGELGPERNRIAVECDWCGEIVEKRPSNTKGRENQFCSYGCYGKWASKNRTGSDAPRWAGGHVDYGGGWNEKKKEEVRERDGRECQHCGRSEEEHIDLYNQKHSVHHIIPARCFTDESDQNSLANLVTLCKGECHNAWESLVRQSV